MRFVQRESGLWFSTALASVFLVTPAFAQVSPPTLLDPVLLDPILIESETDSDTGDQTHLGGASPSDTGTTVIGETSIATRTDETGDVNTLLRSLPTVQYADDTDSDAGQNNDDALNLQPLEISISGGAVNENNIMIDGMGINSLTGTDDPYTSRPTPLARETGSPNLFSVYGLHSQTQFVPTEMVESAEVMDSNVSAEYGEFTGGAVNYTLKKPRFEPGGFVKLSFASADLVKYRLGTEDGENPDGRARPSWQRLGYSAQITQPVNDTTAVIAGYSRRVATARKEMDPQYVAATHENTSYSDFYRLGLLRHLGNGGQLDVGVNITEYRQDWTSNYIEDMSIDVVNKGLLAHAGYKQDLQDSALAGLGLRDMTFSTRLSYQHNSTRNDQSGTVASYWYGSYSDGFITDHFDDWCTPVAGERTACRTGALGDRSYEDRRIKAEAKLEGAVLNGRFKLGGAVEAVWAERAGEGFTLNSATTRITETGLAGFICAPGDATCHDDVYFDTKVDQLAYDVSVQAMKVEGFLEVEQTFGPLQLRGGLRADYDDYMGNLNIAPRLSGTLSAHDRLKLTAGVNRYYSDNYLAYAIHDAVPRTRTWRRSHDETTGAVGDWTQLADLGRYSYGQSGLDTPFNDELTLAVAYRDPLTEGSWRFRMIDRQGKDGFARSQDSSTYANRLTNEGRSQYTSYSLEYQRDWGLRDAGPLERLGIYASAVHAERWVSNTGYFGADGETGTGEDFIYYNDTSYTTSEFQQVTGNLDIPVRSTLEVNASLRDNRVKLGLGADVAFGYWGVIDSGETEMHEHPDYGSQRHDVYEDYKFRAAASTYFTARVQLAEVRDNPVMLDVKVSNLLDIIGNATATDANPWMAGRSGSLGLSYSW